MPPGRRRIDGVAVAEDKNNLSQNLVFTERLITAANSVAAGHEMIFDFAYQSVRNKLLIAIAKHNLARNQIGGNASARDQNVAGEHGGQHAGAMGHDANPAIGTRYIGYQVSFHRVTTIHVQVHSASRHKSGTLSVTVTPALRGNNLTAAQRHGLKHFLMTKFGLEIRSLGRPRTDWFLRAICLVGMCHWASNRLSLYYIGSTDSFAMPVLPQSYWRYPQCNRCWSAWYR